MGVTNTPTTSDDVGRKFADTHSLQLSDSHAMSLRYILIISMVYFISPTNQTFFAICQLGWGFFKQRCTEQQIRTDYVCDVLT